MIIVVTTQNMNNIYIFMCLFMIRIGNIGTRSLRQKVYCMDLKGVITMMFQRYLIFYDPSENLHNATNNVTKDVKDVVKNYKTTVNKVKFSL